MREALFILLVALGMWLFANVTHLVSGSGMTELRFSALALNANAANLSWGLEAE